MYGRMVRSDLYPAIAFALIGYVASHGGPRGELSDQWLLKTSGRSMSVRDLVGRYGFRVKYQPFPNYYLLEKTDANTESVDFVTILREDKLLVESKIEYMKQLRYMDRHTRGPVSKQTGSFNITDNYWEDMWHLKEDQFPSMHVYDVWTMGYTGAGVHVSVLDDGVEPTHSDLVDNYNQALSSDFLYNSSYVNHTETDFHGTWCAGIISATKNNFCVLGVAYESSFSAVKIFDRYYGLTDLGEALALIHMLDQTDIYSNSWGPPDTGTVFGGAGELAKAALQIGINEGREGKGAIYTWANGNGGVNDDCNCDSFANSIYTISTTSVGRDQGASWYSESCSSVFIGTYAGDSPDLTIATTDTGNGCTTVFQGTSAACPMASGIIALVLEARPDLTWRDTQHLIAETASKDGLIRANWQTNGAGKQVSHVYGFGLMNARAMIEMVTDWVLVPDHQTCETEVMQVNRISDNSVSITSAMTTDGCSGRVHYLEHVEVWMIFEAEYRGSMEITLSSPGGTRSILLHEREFDSYNGSMEWTFMTVQSWGENPQGQWTLQLESLESGIVFGLSSWKLVMYGTSSDPLYSDMAAQSDDSDATTWTIVGGVVGGVALFCVVAVVAYFFLKKPKDPTVYPSVQ